jgi:autotransporter adhesin
MQCYTDAKNVGSDVVLEEFQFQYPSEAVTGVKLSADKTYYSTGNKGNFTFKILKNGASEDEVTMPDDTVNATAEPVDDVEKLDSVVTNPSGVKAAAKPERLGTERSLGRQRQR